MPARAVARVQRHVHALPHARHLYHVLRRQEQAPVQGQEGHQEESVSAGGGQRRRRARSGARRAALGCGRRRCSHTPPPVCGALTTALSALFCVVSAAGWTPSARRTGASAAGNVLGIEALGNWSRRQRWAAAPALGSSGRGTHRRSRRRGSLRPPVGSCSAGLGGSWVGHLTAACGSTCRVRSSQRHGHVHAQAWRGSTARQHRLPASPLLSFAATFQHRCCLFGACVRAGMTSRPPPCSTPATWARPW